MVELGFEKKSQHGCVRWALRALHDNLTCICNRVMVRESWMYKTTFIARVFRSENGSKLTVCAYFLWLRAHKCTDHAINSLIG